MQDLDNYSKYKIVKTVDSQLLFVNTQDEYIGRSMLMTGCWEPHIRQCLQKLVQTGDRVIDIGANIGTHTLLLSKLVGKDGKVYAFEPNPHHFYTLFASLLVNKCHNTTIYPYGLSDTTEIMYIEKRWKDTKEVHNFGAIELQRHSVDKDDEPVQVKSLDDFSLQKISLIKIDAERMELKVLKGMKKLIETWKPYLMIEIHNEELSEVQSFIETSGYLLSRQLGMIDFIGVPREKIAEFEEIMS